MNLVRRSPDVFVAPGPVAVIGADEIACLKAAVNDSTHGRVRINVHGDDEDLLHEMFIAMRPDSYIRPHKHLNKSEAFHLVYGAVDVVIFDDNGAIIDIVKLSATGPEAFYYRLSKPAFHTLLIQSDLLVIHEITNGPFRREATVLAPFAPTEGTTEAATYRAELTRRVGAFERPAA